MKVIPLNAKKTQGMLAVAIKLASTAFLQVEDKGGKPYILHCLWVMNKQIRKFLIK